MKPVSSPMWTKSVRSVPNYCNLQVDAKSRDRWGHDWESEKTKLEPRFARNHSHLLCSLCVCLYLVWMRAGFCTKPLNTEFVCIVRDFQTIVNANLLKQKQPHARADVQSLRNHALRAELSFLVVNLLAHCCLRRYNCCVVKYRCMVIMSLPCNYLIVNDCELPFFFFHKETTGRELAKSNCPRVRLLISRFCCRLLFLHPWTIAQVSVILCGSFSYVLILMTVMGYEHLWCGCSHAAEYNTSSYLFFTWSMLVGWLVGCYMAFVEECLSQETFRILCGPSRKTWISPCKQEMVCLINDEKIQWSLCFTIGKLEWSVEVLIARFPWRASPRYFVNSTFIRQGFSLFSLQGMPKNFLGYLSWSRSEVSDFASSWINFLNCQVLQLISCLWTLRVWFVKCLLKHPIEKLVVMAADV